MDKNKILNIRPPPPKKKTKTKQDSNWSANFGLLQMRTNTKLSINRSGIDNITSEISPNSHSMLILSLSEYQFSN